MARTIDPELFEGTEDTAAQNGKGGWETEQTSASPIGTGAVCGTPGASFKRHKWDDQICTHCGATKASVAPERTPREKGTPRTTRASSGTIEQLVGLLWLGAGLGSEHLIKPETPLIGAFAVPVEREDGSTGAAPSVAVGRVLQLEAPIAGKKIEAALRGTAVGKFINALMSATGPWTELIPLMIPPLVIGFAALYPDISDRFKPIMVAMMTPTLSEASRMAEAQSKLMSQLDDVSAENFARAAAAVDAMLGVEPKSPSQ